VERILIVAPSWVGDAILTEPLVGLLRDPFEDPVVDVLVPPWCAPVYARMRGIRRIIETPFSHGKFDIAARKRLGIELRGEGYTHAFVLPNSWKSALVPFFARVPKRVGYTGEARWGLLTDARRIDKRTQSKRGINNPHFWRFSPTNYAIRLRRSAPPANCCRASFRQVTNASIRRSAWSGARWDN